MVPNYKKNKSKSSFSRFLFKFGGILILCVAVLLVIADIRIYQRKKQFNFQVESLKNKIQELEGKNSSLKQEISNADDEKYTEKIAREELGLQRSGEKVVSFVITQNNQSQNSNEKKDILQIWLGWIGSIFKK